MAYALRPEGYCVVAVELSKPICTARSLEEVRSKAREELQERFANLAECPWESEFIGLELIKLVD